MAKAKGLLNTTKETKARKKTRPVWRKQKKTKYDSKTKSYKRVFKKNFLICIIL